MLSRVIVMSKVKVGDIEIYYEIKGEGFPLVMIQGLGSSLEWWAPGLIDGLSKMFKLILFDNRGAGRTDVSDKKYTVKLLADDTAGLMDAIGIYRAYILGISMGGMIAQELILSYPQKVEKLILCSTGTKWCFSQEVSRIFATVTELSQEKLTETILALKLASNFPNDFVRKRPLVIFLFTSDFVRKHPALVDRLFSRAAKHPISKEGWNRQLDAIHGFNSHERLKNIKVPTLVLHGRKDVEIPPENALILARSIPNAKLVYLEKSAHCLVEEMTEVTTILAEFLV